MTSRTLRSENVIDRKMPDVFERLSKHHTNKVNSRRHSKSLNPETHGDLKSGSVTTKKKGSSQVILKNATVGHRGRVKAKAHSNENIKEDSILSESYHEKTLLENVPETVNKDLIDSIVDESSHGAQDCRHLAGKQILGLMSKANPHIEDSSRRNNSSFTNKNEDLVSKSSSPKLIQNHPREENNNNANKISVPLNVSQELFASQSEERNRGLAQTTQSLLGCPPHPDASTARGNTPANDESCPQTLKLKLEDLLFATKVESEDKKPKRSQTVSTNSDKVIDDDKDICEADKEAEDEDFYRVKVQTRLVSYENSTLVIRNTSKQSESPSIVSSQAVGEDAFLSESLPPPPSSLQNSLSDQASSPPSSPVSEDIPVSQFQAEGEQTNLSGVRSKLGMLVTRGKSILSDVRTYSSSYVPDVKTLSNKFQKGVNRRSFKSAMAFAFKDNPQTTCPPPHPSPALSIAKTDQSPEPELKIDSGFSSLIPTPDHSIPPETQESCSVLFDVQEPYSTLANDPEPCLKSPNDKLSPPNASPHLSAGADVSSKMNRTESEDPPSGINDSASVLPKETPTDFSKFFSPCTCQTSSTSDSDQAQEIETELCSCQTDGELPLEIKELLDVDYARMWWTITGNFGNILPIDWSKTYTRQKYLPVLNLNEAKKHSDASTCSDSVTPSPRYEDEDDEVAQDLDLHQLILAGGQSDAEPVKSAEEVIKEIDDIMQEGSSSEDEGLDASSLDSKASSNMEFQRLPPPLYHDKVKDLSVTELNETLMELEMVIRRYSETLIAQLAHRDELEYEKELKNTFISLLLQVQNKRRNYNVEKKKVKKPLGPNGVDPKYLTTVIPYDVGHGPPDNETIQILIKILTAINEDTPTVPTLLTDYILKVLCPS